MKHVNSIKIDYNKEELIPWFSPEFPYIASCAELGKYREREVPWLCPVGSACWKSGLWM